MCFNGKPCRLEHGNLEQIKVLREHEDRVTKLNHAGLPIEPKYRIKFNFKCVCGRSLELDEKVEDEPIFQYEPGEIITCYNCDREYEISIRMTSTWCNASAKILDKIDVAQP